MGRPVNGNCRVERLKYSKAEIKEAVASGAITQAQADANTPRKNLAKVLEVAEEVTIVKKGDIICVMHYDVKPYENEDGGKVDIEVIHQSKIDYVK